MLEEHLGGHAGYTHLDEGALDFVKDILQVKSMLDIGCGPGGMVELANQKDINAIGIDGDYTLDRYDDSKFISTSSDYTFWSKDKKSTVQEFYYRWLRKKLNIFMGEDLKPIGGQWNFDKENRMGISKLKSEIPIRNKTTNDQITFDVMVEVEEIFSKSYGDLENYTWAHV